MQMLQWVGYLAVPLILLSWGRRLHWASHSKVSEGHAQIPPARCRLPASALAQGALAFAFLRFLVPVLFDALGDDTPSAFDDAWAASTQDLGLLSLLLGAYAGICGLSTPASRAQVLAALQRMPVRLRALALATARMFLPQRLPRNLRLLEGAPEAAARGTVLVALASQLEGLGMDPKQARDLATQIVEAYRAAPRAEALRLLKPASIPLPDLAKLLHGEGMRLLVLALEIRRHLAEASGLELDLQDAEVGSASTDPPSGSEPARAVALLVGQAHATPWSATGEEDGVKAAEGG